MKKIINEDINDAELIFAEAVKRKKAKKLKKPKKVSSDQAFLDKTEIWEKLFGVKDSMTYGINDGEFSFQLPDKIWPQGRLENWMKYDDNYDSERKKKNMAELKAKIAVDKAKVAAIYKLYSSKYNFHPYTAKRLNDLSTVVDGVSNAIYRASRITSIDQYASIGGGRRLASKDDFANKLVDEWEAIKAAK